MKIIDYRTFKKIQSIENEAICEVNDYFFFMKISLKKFS